MKMMSPDGSLGEIPAEHIQAAQAAGFRVMTDNDLRTMYQRIFMEHSLIQDQQNKLRKKWAPKQSLRRHVRRKH